MLSPSHQISPSFVDFLCSPIPSSGRCSSRRMSATSDNTHVSREGSFTLSRNPRERLHVHCNRLRESLTRGHLYEGINSGNDCSASVIWTTHGSCESAAGPVDMGYVRPQTVLTAISGNPVVYLTSRKSLGCTQAQAQRLSNCSSSEEVMPHATRTTESLRRICESPRRAHAVTTRADVEQPNSRAGEQRRVTAYLGTNCHVVPAIDPFNAARHQLRITGGSSRAQCPRRAQVKVTSVGRVAPSPCVQAPRSSSACTFAAGTNGCAFYNEVGA